MYRMEYSNMESSDEIPILLVTVIPPLCSVHAPQEQQMMTRRFSLAMILTVTAFFAISLTADEGMYPLSDIARLDLKAKGLEIEVSDIYNPDGVSLVDAICQVGGGTGEFVSADGLILTNHHIAFSGVADASTPENDFLKNGFTARTREE